MSELRDPILRLVPRPTDVNINGHVYGGWLLDYMDASAGIFVRKAFGRAATVAADGIRFLTPVKRGDIVSLYGAIEKRGRTSITIRIEATAWREQSREEMVVAEGLFTFVALDDNDRPRELAPETA